jgi:hypothetical protein
MALVVGVIHQVAQTSALDCRPPVGQPGNSDE